MPSMEEDGYKEEAASNFFHHPSSPSLENESLLVNVALSLGEMRLIHLCIYYFLL